MRDDAEMAITFSIEVHCDVCGAEVSFWTEPGSDEISVHVRNCDECIDKAYADASNKETP